MQLDVEDDVHRADSAADQVDRPDAIDRFQPLFDLLASQLGDFTKVAPA